MAIIARQLGNSLVMTLIFSAVISIILLLLLETTMIDQKMLHQFLAKKRVQLDYITQLTVIEDQLAESFTFMSEDIQIAQWVPDTLACAETSGIRYYRIAKERKHPDGASSHFDSIYAVRGDLPKQSVHPNHIYCDLNYIALDNGDLKKSIAGRTSIIPLSEWLPISKIISQVVVGKAKNDQGLFLYMLVQKKYHAEQMIVIVADELGKEPYLYKMIDPESYLHSILLRNRKLLVNSDEWLMIFDALEGDLLTKEELRLVADPASTNNSSQLMMLVRKPREAKRLILAPTHKGWAQAEVAIDEAVLGRRVWHE